MPPPVKAKPLPLFPEDIHTLWAKICEQFKIEAGRSLFSSIKLGNPLGKTWGHHILYRDRETLPSNVSPSLNRLEYCDMTQQRRLLIFLDIATAAAAQGWLDGYILVFLNGLGLSFFLWRREEINTFSRRIGGNRRMVRQQRQQEGT